MKRLTIRRLASALAVGLALSFGMPAQAQTLSSASSVCGADDRGRLLVYDLVASYATPADVQAYFNQWLAFYQDYYNFPPDIPATFSYGFDSYRVTYCTVDARLPGQRSAAGVAATGMLSVPRNSRPMSTVLYLHGTSVSFYDAVSNPAIAGGFNPGGESFDGPPSNAIFAGAGFIYVGPDYLGLGGSAVPRHRYFHAPTEASAAIDLFFAAGRVLRRLGVTPGGKLFTFGFSQGGHAALATHRALQDLSIPVKGTATVGGVFDVEQWFLSSVSNTTTITLPLYVSYVLLAYDDVYDVYARSTDVFRRPWASRVDGLFDMQHYFDDVLAALPATSHQLLTAAFQRSLDDQGEPIRRRLRQNAVDTWRPRAPLRVFHSIDDEEVPIGGAQASVDRLRQAGARVSMVELAGYDHVNSWIQAMPQAVDWFRSLE